VDVVLVAILAVLFGGAAISALLTVAGSVASDEPDGVSSEERRAPG